VNYTKCIIERQSLLDDIWQQPGQLKDIFQFIAAAVYSTPIHMHQFKTMGPSLCRWFF